MLGSRKLLIILCIVPCVLSFVCIGAFAAPAEDVIPSFDLPLETEVVEDVVKSPSALAVETFPAQPLLTSEYYHYSCTLNQLPDSDATALPCLGFSCYDSNGKYICSGSGFDSSLRLGIDNSSGIYGLFYHGVFYPVGETVYNNLPNYSVSFSSANSSLTIGGSSVSGTLVEESLVPDIADSVFDLGDALITFIMSSWVVMIPLAAWLVILCIGAIRKLVKGV